MAEFRSFNTWNRYLNVKVNYGGITSEELLKRTLSLTYVDRATEFDYIEWQLDNKDGELTKLENIALGLLVSIQLGYTDSYIPWKTFVINHIKGGVGSTNNVTGAYPMTANEGVITFEGRNRNAPGGSGPKKRRRTARRYHTQRTKRKSKGRKIYTPTSDILNTEVAMQEKESSIIKAPTTSDAVRQIAVRNGYKLEDIYIEDTKDSITHVVIPPGVTDFQWVNMMAKKFGYMLKSEKDFHFHTPYWDGASQKIIQKFIYGKGNDILKLDIDADFRLPVPSQLKTTHYDWKRRVAVVNNSSHDDNVKQLKMGINFNEGVLNDPIKKKMLTRTENIVAVGNYQTAAKKAVKRFLQRHWRSFQINLDIVGNPLTLATRHIELGGTGTPLVDGIWYVVEAKHIVSENTYITQLTLKHPRKKQGRNKGHREVGITQHSEKDDERKQQKQVIHFHEGVKVKRTVRN